MENYDPSANKKTVKCTTDSFFAFWAQLKEAFPHRFGVWHLQIWPKFEQKFDQSGIISQNAIRPGLNLSLDAGMKIFDGVAH